MARWGATPLGGAVAQLARNPHSLGEVLERFFGSSSCGARVRAVLSRQALNRPGALQSPRTDRGVQGAMLRVLLCVLSEMDPRTRCSAGKRLWQGERDRTTVPEGGCPRLWRINGRRGLAARAGVSTRQLQRYLLAWERGGVLTRRQPGAEKVAQRLRGKNYAYAVYQLLTEVPRAVADRLARWRKGGTARPAPRPPSLPSCPEPRSGPWVPDWGALARAAAPPDA